MLHIAENVSFMDRLTEVMPGTVCQYISYLLAILSAVFLVLCCNFLLSIGPLQFLSHLYHLSLSLSYPVCSIYDIVSMQSKVCKSVFSRRPILLLSVQVSPNPVRHCRVVDPPRLASSTAKSWKSPPQSSPQNMQPADRLMRKKLHQFLRGRGAPRWGRGEDDVTWRRVRFSGGWQQVGVTSEFREYVPATGSQFKARIWCPSTWVEAPPSSPAWEMTKYV